MGEKICSFEGCEDRVQGTGLCSGHYQQKRRGIPLAPKRPRRPATVGCSYEGCTRQHKARGWCDVHYRLWWLGEEMRPVTEYYNAPGSLNAAGYRVLFRPHHPNAHKNGQVLEHVVVMSEMLGRPLLPGETVHHRNRQKSDNRPENLQLWTGSQPPNARVEDMVVWAKELLDLYEPDYRKECACVDRQESLAALR